MKNEKKSQGHHEWTNEISHGDVFIPANKTVKAANVNIHLCE